jgi:integrase
MTRPPKPWGCTAGSWGNSAWPSPKPCSPATSTEGDRRKAGRFVSDFLRGKGLSQATIKRKLWSLSSFWKWMARRGLIEEGRNPWSGQGDRSGRERARRARKAGTDTDKRPFEKEELVRLLRADPAEHSGGRYSGAMADLMRLGLVTGCRLDELCELRVADVRAGDRAIHVPGGKTANARRTIPVLEAAWGIIERRLDEAPKGAPGAYLFPDLKPGGPDRKRSHYLTKVFTRVRRSVLGDGQEVKLASV